MDQPCRLGGSLGIAWRPGYFLGGPSNVNVCGSLSLGSVSLTNLKPLATRRPSRAEPACGVLEFGGGRDLGIWGQSRLPLHANLIFHSRDCPSFNSRKGQLLQLTTASLYAQGP